MFGKCPSHPIESVSHYCGTCKLPVCLKCKMDGNHALGEAAQHKLIEITSAYEHVHSQSLERDEYIDHRKEAINEKLARVHDRIRDVKDNAFQIQEELYNKYMQAMEELQYITKEKVRVLNGEQLELERQFYELEWCDHFLVRLREEALPVQFLIAWQKHAMLRSRLQRPNADHFSIFVKPDIQVKGSLHAVSADGHVAARDARGQDLYTYNGAYNRFGEDVVESDTDQCETPPPGREEVVQGREGRRVPSRGGRHASQNNSFSEHGEDRAMSHRDFRNELLSPDSDSDVY